MELNFVEFINVMTKLLAVHLYTAGYASSVLCIFFLYLRFLAVHCAKQCIFVFASPLTSLRLMYNALAWCFVPLH